jgi:hypothetical protein
MKKSDYSQLTRLGVRAMLEKLQDYLTDVFADFPEEFNTQTPPLFLRAEEKTGGNSWPVFRAVSRNGTEPADAVEPILVSKKTRHWTPAARRKASERMLKRNTDQEWGSVIWHRIHDYLLKAPKRSARLGELAKALKEKESSISSALNRHEDRIRYGANGYTLVKPVSAAEKKSKKAHIVAPRKAAKKHWGQYHWQMIHDYLLTQPEHVAPISQIMKNLKIPTQASAITSMQSHKDLFRRSSPGTYQLIKEAPEEMRTGG